MPMMPLLATLADTLLVRPVDMPTPWYSVASGVLSVIVTLLLLGIAIALLGMARAVKHAESRFGVRIQGLADELIPLAKNLNQIAVQLSEVTTAARADLARLSGTVAAVDDAVRDALDAGESRLAQFGTLIDAVQDEAQSTIASATGLVRGVRTGAGALLSGVFSRGTSAKAAPARRSLRRDRDAADATLLHESAIIARIAALEAALADIDSDEDDEEEDERSVSPRRAGGAPARTASEHLEDDDADEDAGFEDFADDDDDEDDGYDDDSDDDDGDDDDLDDDDGVDDDGDDDGDDDDSVDDDRDRGEFDDDGAAESNVTEVIDADSSVPQTRRTGGPQIRRRPGA